MWKIHAIQCSQCKLSTSTTMTSLLLDSCFSIVGKPEQAACSKRAVQIQLQRCKNFTRYNSVELITKIVMQFRKSRWEYISTFSFLCTPWMAVVIHTSGVTYKVQSSKCIHICTAGYTWVPKPDINRDRILEKGPKHNFLLLLNLLPFQGHKSPRLPTWFVDSLDLLLHWSNVIS